MPYPDMPYPNGTVPLCSDWMSAPTVCLHVVQSGWVDYIRSLRTFQVFCEGAVPEDHEYESEGSFHSQLANDSEEADDSDESGGNRSLASVPQVAALRFLFGKRMVDGG